MKSILLALISLVMSQSVIAQNKIAVVNLSSNTGSHYAIARALSQDLESMGHRVEFISPGNSCQASAIISRLPKDTVVIANPAPFNQADIVSGKQSCRAVLPTRDNLAYLSGWNYTLCTLTQNENPKAFFQPGSSFRVGHIKPQQMWTDTVHKLNQENKTKHNAIQYNGAGPTKAALMAKEVDYVILGMPHALTLQKNGAACVAEFTKNKPVVLGNTVKDLSAGSNDFDVGESMSFVLLNADIKSRDLLRQQILSIMLSESNNSSQARSTGSILYDHKDYGKLAEIAIKQINIAAGKNQ